MGVQLNDVFTGERRWRRKENCQPIVDDLISDIQKAGMLRDSRQ